MFRMFIVLVVAVGIAGGVAYSQGWLNDYLDPVTQVLPPVFGQSSDGSKQARELGELLYPRMALQPLPEVQAKQYSELVIDSCHAVVPVENKQDVSSQKEGHLLFIGREVEENEQGKFALAGQKVLSIPLYDGASYDKRKYFVPLREGDVVEFAQVVALVDPSLAMQEIASKQAKIYQAQADYKATERIQREAQKRLDKLNHLRSLPGGDRIVTDIELGDASVAVAKYDGEEITKRQQIETAKAEFRQTQLFYQQHYLTSKIPGKSIVKKIYKATGEGVKAQEPVLQLWSETRLRVEGSLDSQYFLTLQANKNAPCFLEPSIEMEPRQALMKAHQAEVTCVAFCADGEHFVSGSEDSKVYVWKRGRNEPIRMLSHSSPVRTVACSPKGSWIVVGCADGSISRWDVSKEPQQVEFKDKHRGPVTALAFSPNGAYVASGGEDNAIILWNTDGEIVYPFDGDHGVDDPHQGAVTSLHFTPQCTLVSAARDSTLRVWALHKEGAKRIGQAITNRGELVSELGVSADGRFMLFNKGKTLQLLDSATGAPVCVLDNLGANPFDTLALFSPDGSLMLTGGAGDGRLHLWKAPTAQDRAYQVRELVSKDRAAITSAAFAPAGHRFAVSGSKDGYVHLWALPDDNAVGKHPIFKDANNKELILDVVDQELNAGKTRIAVNVQTPRDELGTLRLQPGRRVTVVLILPLPK